MYSIMSNYCFEFKCVDMEIKFVNGLIKISWCCRSPGLWASAPLVRRVFDAHSSSAVQQVEHFAGVQLSLRLPQLLYSFFLEL